MTQPDTAITPESTTLRKEIAAFPWAIVASSLAVLVAGHALGTETWNMLKEHVPVLILFSSGLVLMLLASAMLVRQRYVGGHHSWLLAWLAVVGANWLALGAHALLHGLGWALFLLAAAAFIACHKAQTKWLEARKPAEVLPKHQTAAELAAHPPRLMLVLLSPPNMNIAGLERDGPVTLSSRSPATAPLNLILHRRDLEEDIRVLERLKPATFFNWQQQLRSLHTPSFTRIPDIVFFGSRLDYLQSAKLFFKPYVDASTRIAHRLVEDFTDFDTLQETLRKTISDFNVPADRVVVDITGGFGISSAAATLFTAKSLTRVQWVPTGPTSGTTGDDPLKPNHYYDIRELLVPFAH